MSTNEMIEALRGNGKRVNQPGEPGQIRLFSERNKNGRVLYVGQKAYIISQENINFLEKLIKRYGPEKEIYRCINGEIINPSQYGLEKIVQWGGCSNITTYFCPNENKHFIINGGNLVWVKPANDGGEISMSKFDSDGNFHENYHENQIKNVIVGIVVEAERQDDSGKAGSDTGGCGLKKLAAQHRRPERFSNLTSEMKL